MHIIPYNYIQQQTTGAQQQLQQGMASTHSTVQAAQEVVEGDEDRVLQLALSPSVVSHSQMVNIQEQVQPAV